jgi:aspartate racemase
MEGAFYADRFAEHGVETVSPDAPERETVDRVIFDELTHGEVREASREAYLDVIDDLVAAGAEGIVFGCTEIDLLLDAEDVPVPVFDTTALHVERALERALEPVAEA